MLKTLISFGLMILVFTGALHIDFHDQVHAEGYNICTPECDDEKHHSFLHQCEQCLNKNNRIIFHEKINFSDNKKGAPFLFFFEGFNKTVTNFSLYSRPPPPQVSIS
mgnify:FL=1|jgi:hypothetical protein